MKVRRTGESKAWHKKNDNEKEMQKERTKEREGKK